MRMRPYMILLCAAFGGTFLALAFPPAPHHIIEGTLRDELGNPILDSSRIIRFVTEQGAVIESTNEVGRGPDTNYQIVIPMDSGTTDTPYDRYAQTQRIPYRIEVEVQGRIYYPIEIRGVSLNLGQPGDVTRLNLTLGEDADGDGLPDAWERALAQQSGGLENVNAEDDSDGDGLSNLEEYYAGTYAFDANDGLRLVFKEISDASLSFEFLGVAGRTYTLLQSTDLEQWSEVRFELKGHQGDFGNVYVPTSQLLQIILPRSAEEGSLATYRLLVK